MTAALGLRLHKACGLQNAHPALHNGKGVKQDDITFVNIYASNRSTKIHKVLTDLKREIDSNTVIVGILIPPFTSMDRSSRHQINRETSASNSMLDQMDLIDVYRMFHPKVEYTFKCTWNILRERLPVRPQNKSQ